MTTLYLIILVQKWRLILISGLHDNNLTSQLFLHALFISPASDTENLSTGKFLLCHVMINIGCRRRH